MAKKSEMSLIEHLEELRKRLFICILGVFTGTVIAFSFVNRLRALLTRPAGGLQLIYVSPPEALVANIRLSVMAGIIIGMPILLFQVLSFVFPALNKNERRLIFPVIIGMIIFFAAGVFFAYTAVFPYAIGFFLKFAADDVMPMFTVTNYLSFTTNFLFAFGVVFQMPLLFWLLGKLNLVTAQFLRSNRKYALLIIVIVAAFITPPDVVTQLMMAGPLLLLYELGVVLVMLSQRGKPRNQV